VELLLSSSAVVLAQQSDPLSGFLLPFVFLVVLYLLLIRPQAKRRKELVRLAANLRVGDLVATIGGIHGEVQAVESATVDLAVSYDADGKPDVVIRFDRPAIVRVIEATTTAGDDA
jgi:preprotein translocase subunit YajC